MENNLKITRQGSSHWKNHRNRGHQPYVVELISTFVPNGIGVEIGINEGQLSCCILNNTNTKHLHLIDPWITWEGWRPQSDLENFHKFCSINMPKLYPGRVSVIRKKSSDAINDVPDDLDFVFIDGNHDYNYIKNDLKIWGPKIRSGGMLFGHDWSHQYVGVVTAVGNYFLNNKDYVPFYENYESLGLKLKYQAAPIIAPIVNKSSKSYVWWMIKK